MRFEDSSEIDALLDSAGLPPCEDGALLISRTVGVSKPSRAFVNSSPAPLSFLSRLGGYWIDFHGPGEPQKLFSRRSQLEMLDTFAGDSGEIAEYMRIYSERREVLAQIEELSQARSLGADEIEFLRSRIAAIDALNPTEEGIAQLEEKSKLAEAASDIAQKSAAAAEAIGGDGGALESVAAAAKLAAEIARLCRLPAPACGAGKGRFFRAFRHIVRIRGARGLIEHGRGGNRGSSRQDDRLARLCRKYGRSVGQVLAARAEMAGKIEMQSDVRATIAGLEERASSLLSELSPIAEKIFKLRSRAARKLADAASKTLLGLGFKNARLDIGLARVPEPSPDCGSSCEFAFSANPGQPLLPLAKIASSGELARVMLALKTVLAEADSTPILVFDEVDANVGGEIGAEVGQAARAPCRPPPGFLRDAPSAGRGARGFAFPRQKVPDENFDERFNIEDRRRRRPAGFGARAHARRQKFRVGNSPRQKASRQKILTRPAFGEIIIFDFGGPRAASAPHMRAGQPFILKWQKNQKSADRSSAKSSGAGGR